MRSLERKRVIVLFYIYQDPLVAWEFTKQREAKEGRRVPKEVFISQLFLAKENVNRIKREFGEAVQLFAMEKDAVKNTKKLRQNIESIDTFITIPYTKESLIKRLC